MARQSLSVSAYYPEHLKGLLPRLEAVANHDHYLLGFGETLKWLARILSENGIVFELVDWRPEFVGHDCCGHEVRPIDQLSTAKDPVIILCLSELDEINACLQFLVNSRYADIPTVYHFAESYDPLEQEEPFRSIARRSRARATSVNGNDRQFNLLQLVRETRAVPGDIVELGSFTGGTGALIAETLRELRVDKRVWLCDSFAGIPRSNLGVDERWSGTFTNNSFREVQQKFCDLPNVRVRGGHITEMIGEMDFPMSLVHIDVDTYECAKAVTEHVWPRLSTNGVILYDDYGFFPNCLPLTAYVNEFVQTQPDAFRFYLPSNGYFILKR